MKDRRCEEAKILDRAWNVELPRERDRFSVIAALEPRQLVEISLDQICQANQELRSLGRGRLRPGGICNPCRLDRAIDVARVAVRNLRDPLLGRRIDVVDVCAARRRDKLAADKVSESLQGIPQARTPTDRCRDPTSPTAE